MSEPARLAEVPPRQDWKALAKSTGERLKIAEESLRETRKQADELRARATKYKTRLDNAQSQLNDAQTKIVEQATELETLRERVARQEIIKRKVHEYRESLLNGPLWELFAEL